MRILLCLLTLICVCPAFASDRHIVIDKEKRELFVIETNDTIFRAGVCLGKAYGQKKKEGDNRTPEGDFEISKIQNSKNWLFYPYKGAKGVRNCYGPWFLRLKTPMSSHIGIHGTSKPSSIGKRQSMGCIRLTNENITKLHDLVYPGMKVTITADRISEKKHRKKSKQTEE